LNSLASDLLIVLKNQKYKILGMSATAATSVVDMKAIGYKATVPDVEYKSEVSDSKIDTKSH
jgi:hypothetical protein